MVKKYTLIKYGIFAIGFIIIFLIASLQAESDSMKKKNNDEGLNFFWYLLPFLFWILFGWFLGWVGVLIGLSLAFFLTWFFNRKRKKDIKDIMKIYTMVILIFIVVLVIFFFVIYPMII